VRGSVRSAAAVDVDAAFEEHRVGLTAACYRMLGSAFDAEDAVQEALVRAWRAADRFEGRSSVRSWLYRIAMNVCFDMLADRRRRAQPMDLVPPSPPTAVRGPARPDDVWVQPVPDGRVVPAQGDPAELAAARESVRLAFVAALQHLTPRQRAVLILRDVLRFRASEVAELLDVTVVSVKSTLQRARAALAAVQALHPDAAGPAGHPAGEAGHEALLARYVDAFERFDIDRLVALLHEDVTLAMPPHDLWLRGRADVVRWIATRQAARGARLVPVAANGGAGYGYYKRSAAGGLEPFGVELVEVRGDRIGAIHVFIDLRLFPLFGLPLRLGA
jgi:RNA polymerase sigma-70 factor (ECF subfamily)